MVATYIKKIMHNFICVTGVDSREMIFFLSVKCLGFLKKTLTSEFTQTPNV